MMIARLWDYISRRIKVSMSSSRSIALFVIAFDDAIIIEMIINEQKKKYKKEKKNYENELIVWEKKHEECMIMLTLTCDEQSRIFIKNFTNVSKTYEILKREYDIIDLVIIDVSMQKLCRVNCVDKEELIEYSIHMKHHINILLQSDIIFLFAFLNFIFKMSLSLDQIQYIFSMIHFVKTRDVELTIDEMIVALIDIQRRIDYQLNSVDVTRATKDFNQENRDEENNESYNNSSNERNNESSNQESFIFNNNKNICNCNFDQHSCDHCDFKAHCEFDCSYKHAHKRVDDWKLYETKIDLIVDWIKLNDFNSIQSNDTRDYNHNNHFDNRDNNDDQRDDDEDKIKRVKFDSFTLSISTISSSINTLVKRILSARRVHRSHRDFNFWLDNDVDSHMCYNKNLFHDLRFLATIKIVETTIDDIVVVEGVESITFQFKINEQKITNIVIDVEYVLELEYNLISIDLLESKNCEIVAKQDRMIVIDLDDDHIFMIETRQHVFEKKLLHTKFLKIFDNQINQVFHHLNAMTSSSRSSQHEWCTQTCNHESLRRLEVL